MQMRFLAAAAVLLMFAGCGSDDGAGGHGGHSNGASSQELAVDRAFVAAMVPHHESAVEMAEIAERRGQSEFVKTLAADIIRTQNAEISTMRAEDSKLADEGAKPGSLGVPEHMMGMEDDPTMLNDAKPFDREFLRMMIPHHQGAVTMAKV